MPTVEFLTFAAVAVFGREREGGAKNYRSSSRVALHFRGTSRAEEIFGWVVGGSFHPDSGSTGLG